jgi:hypothetical protein
VQSAQGFKAFGQKPDVRTSSCPITPEILPS